MALGSLETRVSISRQHGADKIAEMLYPVDVGQCGSDEVTVHGNIERADAGLCVNRGPSPQPSPSGSGSIKERRFRNRRPKDTEVANRRFLFGSSFSLWEKVRMRVPLSMELRKVICPHHLGKRSFSLARAPVKARCSVFQTPTKRGGFEPPLL